MSDRLPLSYNASIFNEGVVRSWERGAGIGTVSLPGSLTRLCFGHRAVDEAAFERLREGALCRFAVDEASSSASLRVSRVVAE